jgi:hypothetical protein
MIASEATEQLFWFIMMERVIYPTIFYCENIANKKLPQFYSVAFYTLRSLRFLCSLCDR